MSENEQNSTVQGVLEQQGKSGGFLRSPKKNLQVAGSDVSVSAALCAKAGLRGGEWVTGTVANSNGKRGARQQLAEITQIQDMSIDDYLELKRFDTLTALNPQRQIRFETPGGSMSMRIVDLLTPIGFGQRALIAAPPRTGKTVLLQQLSNAVAINHPEAHLIVLLIDERPEEVTDMRRSINGEVFASSNDHDISSHIRISKLVMERAKRLVEAGKDVVLFLDSLTRLGRAHNNHIRGGGRIMSGGLDTRALAEPKAFFGAARNLEDGGSLTIIATALIETGSRMDEVIFNEFKGTGNMEMLLSRSLADRRIYPAIDLARSGTRKEEQLLDEKTLAANYEIRRTMLDKQPERGMERLLEVMGKTKDNNEFIGSFDGRRIR